MTTHARLGSLSKWFCPGCFTYQRPSSYPCRSCCGWTGRSANVQADVRNAFGKPTNKVPS